MPDPTKATLSATQTPALFGASPYLTRWMLARHFIHGDPIDSPEHNRMNWGTKMQPILLAQAAEDLRLEVRPNAGDDYVRHGLLGCTRDADIICPDRGPGALETKCCFDYGTWMETWNGGKSLPKHIEIQTQQQMMVGDGTKPFAWGVIAVWVCGEMKYFERKPIPDLWYAINIEAQKFFDDVAAKREGEPFGETIEMPLLAQIFKPVVGKVLDLTTHPRAEELANQAQLMNYHAAEASAHEKAAKASKALFKAVIEDAEEAILPHGIKLTATQQSRAGHAVKPSTFTTIKAYVPKDLPAPIEPTSKHETMLTDLAGG
jgi:hypothetical protein